VNKSFWDMTDSELDVIIKLNFNKNLKSQPKLDSLIAVVYNRELELLIQLWELSDRNKILMKLKYADDLEKLLFHKSQWVNPESA